MLGVNQRNVLFVATAAIMWGTWSVFLRPLEVSVWTSTPIIFGVMGLLALPVALMGRTPANWDRRTVIFLIAHGMCAAGNVTAYFLAMTYTTLAVAVLTHYLAPILVAVLAPWIDRERIPGAPVAAFAACIGLLLILEPWASVGDRGNLKVGAALGMGSAVFFAGNVFLAKRLEPRIGANRTIAYHALVAAVVLLPFMRGDVGQLSASSLGLIVAGAAFPGALAGVLFVVGLAKIGSSRAAVLAYFEPLVAVGLGWAVWHEQLSVFAILGAGCIVAAGVWVARDPYRHRD